MTNIHAPTLDRETHARIFARYIANCSLADLRAILDDAEACAREQLNGNICTQSRADTVARLNIQYSVDRMLASDLRHVDKLIDRAANPV